jgi:hypothetical protein
LRNKSKETKNQEFIAATTMEYESDDVNSLVNTKGTFGAGDEYEDEDMEFVIPSCYS